jgi:hypothetical protein
LLTRFPSKSRQLIWDILGSDPNMMKRGEQFGNFMKMLVDCVKLTRPVGFTGPVCGNPACREFGHTLAVCPKPTNMEHGDMLGCFFCNTVDHDADDWLVLTLSDQHSRHSPPPPTDQPTLTTSVSQRHDEYRHP